MFGFSWVSFSPYPSAGTATSRTAVALEKKMKKMEQQQRLQKSLRNGYPSSNIRENGPAIHFVHNTPQKVAN